MNNFESEDDNRMEMNAMIQPTGHPQTVGSDE